MRTLKHAYMLCCCERVFPVLRTLSTGFQWGFGGTWGLVGGKKRAAISPPFFMFVHNHFWPPRRLPPRSKRREVK